MLKVYRLSADGFGLSVEKSLESMEREKTLLLFKNKQTKKNKVGLSFPDNLEKRSQEKDIC